MRQCFSKWAGVWDLLAGFFKQFTVLRSGLWLARSGQAWELAFLTSSPLAVLCWIRMPHLDSRYPKMEKLHTLTVIFSWLMSSSLGLLRHGHFKKQTSEDTGKNHFPSASASFCFKMAVVYGEHSGRTHLMHGQQEKLPYLVLIVEKQPWISLDVLLWMATWLRQLAPCLWGNPPFFPGDNGHQAWHSTH